MQEALYSRFDLYPVTEQVKEMRLSWGGGTMTKAKHAIFAYFPNYQKKSRAKD